MRLKRPGVVLLASLAAAQIVTANAQAGGLAHKWDPDLKALITEALPGPEVATFGVAIAHVPTGYVAYSNSRLLFESASLLKLPVLYEAYRQRSVGRLSFGEQLEITERHAEIAFGYTPVPVGDALSVDRAIELMITASDNASAIALIDRLGNFSINRTMQDIELASTAVLADSVTTPRDMLTYFELLESHEAVDWDSSEEMLARLSRQRINDRIPMLLPSGTEVAHKTGDDPGVINDAGIVYTPAGPVIIVLLANDVQNGPGVRRAMAELSLRIYEYAEEGGFGDYPPSDVSDASLP
ncbi:MAG TPA: serine hydrolase [Chloroflexota bacterium]